jgi:hypothetical protein
VNPEPEWIQIHGVSIGPGSRFGIHPEPNPGKLKWQNTEMIWNLVLGSESRKAKMAPKKEKKEMCREGFLFLPCNN